MAMSERMCSIESCERPYIAKGLCSSHYARKRKYGDPNAQRRRDRDMSIPEILTHYSQPDGECVAWGGPKSSSGYGCFRRDGVYYTAHRAAWEVEHGPIPDGMLVDHTCFNRACVRVEHLRLATRAENNSNRSGQMPGSATGVRNVYATRTGEFAVKVQSGGVRRWLGQYPTLEEAERVAENARAEMFGEFAGRSRVVGEEQS